MCDSGIIKYNRTGKGNKKYECTKSYRHYSGWQRTLGESQGNAEKLWSCEGLCQSGDSLRLHERTGSQIRDSICVFHRELEAFQRRSGWPDEAVSQLSEEMYQTG